MVSHYPLYINGEFTKSGLKEYVFNPSTGETIASTGFVNAEGAEFAISSARKAFDKGPWKNITLAQRKDFLLKIHQGILDKAAELANLETLNTGKPIKETTFMDIPSSAQTFEYFANNLERYLEEESIDIQSQVAKVKGSLIREPRGVTVLIVPWNYPLLIASWKLAQSMAAGNTVILKPSSLTPLSVLELAKIIDEAGLPKGVVNVIVGKGEVLGKKLCSDKRVDMVSFTGSNSVGRKILEYSSRNVKKLIMELGGKSASIILKDADLEAAVNGSLCSIFLNQGQMCTAMSRIFIEDDIYDAFVDDFIAKAKRIKLGNGLNFETQMGPLISREQRKRVKDFVERAKKEGVHVLCGGDTPVEEDLKNGFFFKPTVLAKISPKMGIFQEEVFGPVVCISRFCNMDEAVELVNNSSFGLAACVWSKDELKAKLLAKKINAGTIWINTYGMFFNELPYGGFKQSGFGKELGKEGFLEYTQLKNIIADTAQHSKPLVSHWYGF